MKASVNKDYRIEESLVVYGLQADPFPVGESDGFFFTTEALAQHVDTLHNLVQYSESLLVITGVDGAGKTTLLEQLVTSAGDRWRVCRITGSTTTSVHRIVREMMEGFGLPVRGDDQPAHLDLLRAHLATLHRSNQIVLVATDDADRLPESTRVFLMELASESSGHKTRLVFTCAPGGLAIGTKAAEGTDGVHVVELEPLSLEQTGDYVHTRLSHAGLVGDSPFTAHAVGAIYRDSHGVPGAIHPLARDVLTSHAGDQRRGRTLRAGSGAARAMRLLLAVVVLGGAAALLLESHPLLTGWSQTAEPRNAAIGESLVPSPESRVSSSDSRTPSHQSRITSSESRVAIHPLEPTPVAKYSLEEKYAPTTRLVRAREPTLATGKTTLPEGAAPVLASGVHDLPWLRAQNPDQYVIQLVGTREPSAMRKFLEFHQLGSQAAWFVTSHQDQPWYVVVYGLYPSKQSARAAIRTLPRELRKERPWPRSIASIVKSTR